MIRNDKTLSRLHWTEEEQRLLKNLRESEGIRSWTTIANQLNKAFEGLYRSGKQCRERYMNYVRFSGDSNRSTVWSREQDELLFQKFLIFGRKWVEICKQMPGRSQNCIKNRFYGAIRKISRRVIRIFKEKKLKQKKILKKDAYIKILECRQSVSSNETAGNESSNDFIIQLQRDLIRMAIKSQEDIIAEQIESIVNRIHEFISNTKIKPLERGKSSISTPETSNSLTKQEEKQINMPFEQNQLEIHCSEYNQTLSPKNSDYKQSEMKKDQFNFFELGLNNSQYTNLVNHDLELELSQILNQQFRAPTHFLY